MDIFSERLGFKPVQDIIYIDSVPDALFNRIWNCFFGYIKKSGSNKINPIFVYRIVDELWKKDLTAIEQYKNRENPNYANVIKNSMDAVETVAKTITGKKQATFKNLMATLKGQHDLPPTMEQAFKKFYGFASQEKAIRHTHPLKDDKELKDATDTEARYMLVICSAL